MWKQAQELLKEKEAALAEAGKQARQELDKAVEDLRAKAASELQHAVAKLEVKSWARPGRDGDCFRAMRLPGGMCVNVSRRSGPRWWRRWRR